MAKKKAKKKSSKKGRVPAGLAAESPKPKRKKAAKKAAKKTRKKTGKKTGKKTAKRAVKKSARKRATRAPGSPIGRAMASNPEFAKAVAAFEARHTLPRKKSGKKSKKAAVKQKAGNVNATAAQILGGTGTLRGGWMGVGKGHMHTNHPVHNQAMKIWVCSAAKPRGCGGGGKVVQRSNY